MKLDTSTINGFDTMSDSEKVAALLGIEVPDAVDLSGYVAKSVFDKKASEAADLSKRLKARQTDEENAAQAQAEAQAALQKSLDEATATIAALTREKTVSKLTADYIAQGYDKDLAVKAAEALTDGDTGKVMEYASQHSVAREKALRAELLKGTPTPPGADGGEPVPDNVQTAKAMGAAKAANMKASNDVLANYIKQ